LNYLRVKRKKDQATAIVDLDHVMAAEPMTGGGMRLFMSAGQVWEIEGTVEDLERRAGELGITIRSLQ
jgi:hypothetical protein